MAASITATPVSEGRVGTPVTDGVAEGTAEGTLDGARVTPGVGWAAVDVGAVEPPPEHAMTLAAASPTSRDQRFRQSLSICRSLPPVSR